MDATALQPNENGPYKIDGLHHPADNDGTSLRPKLVRPSCLTTGNPRENGT
jgi:hypothetical protein